MVEIYSFLRVVNTIIIGLLQKVKITNCCTEVWASYQSSHITINKKISVRELLRLYDLLGPFALVIIPLLWLCMVTSVWFSPVTQSESSACGRLPGYPPYIEEPRHLVSALRIKVGSCLASVDCHAIVQSLIASSVRDLLGKQMNWGCWAISVPSPQRLLTDPLMPYFHTLGHFKPLFLPSTLHCMTPFI